MTADMLTITTIVLFWLCAYKHICACAYVQVYVCVRVLSTATTLAATLLIPCSSLRERDNAIS